MTVRAVFFDLGDTLWHMPDPPPVDTIRKETVRRISELLRSWDVEPDGEFFFLGRDIRLAVAQATADAYAGDLRDPHCPTLAREVAASKGLEISTEQAEQLWETWNLGGPFFGRRLFDGTLEMLEALRDGGYRLGCVTNRGYGGPAFVEEVEEHGLADFFEAMAVSCDIGYMKPHRDIFQHALDAMDLDPEAVAMVGDSLHADVAGAQALGMTAIWRRPKKVREEQDGIQPDFTIDEMREIPHLSCFQ